MAPLNPPSFLQGVATETAAEARLMLGGLVTTQGIVAPGDLAVAQHSTPNMSVDVAAGGCWIKGTESSSQGVYHCYNDALVTLVIAAADATNPRRDLVIAKVQDAFYSGGVNAWSLAVVTGTPAGSPADPAVPANSLILARVAVAALAGSIVSANITNLRTSAVLLNAPGKYKARMHLVGAQVFTTAGVVVALDTVDYDPNGNATTGAAAKYTAPVGGFYIAAFNIKIAAFVGNTRAYGTLWKNGASASAGSDYGTNAGYAAGSGSDILQLAAGDYLQLQAQTASTNVNAQNDPNGSSNFLAVHFLSPL